MALAPMWISANVTHSVFGGLDSFEIDVCFHLSLFSSMLIESGRSITSIIMAPLQYVHYYAMLRGTANQSPVV